MLLKPTQEFNMKTPFIAEIKYIKEFVPFLKIKLSKQSIVGCIRRIQYNHLTFMYYQNRVFIALRTPCLNSFKTCFSLHNEYGADGVRDACPVHRNTRHRASG